MKILQYREFINTECTNTDNTILNKKAIKIDGVKSLKKYACCTHLKSCDYLKYKKSKIILVEISDLKAQIINLKKSYDTKEILQMIYRELKEKITQTLLFLEALSKKILFDTTKHKIFTIAICTESKSDILIFSKIVKDLKKHLQIFLYDVKLVPVVELKRML